MNAMFYHLTKQFSVDAKRVMTSLQLYKYLLRQCERLPLDACKHYKFAVKQVMQTYIKYLKVYKYYQPQLLITYLYFIEL